MKRLFILSVLLALALLSFGQATPSSVVRVALRTTAFGKNLPAGTQIYCVADSTLWVVGAAGIVTTGTITSGLAAATLRLENKADLSINRTSTTAVIRSNFGHGNVGSSATIGVSTADSAGLMSGADFTKLAGLSAGAGVTKVQDAEVAADTLTLVSHLYLGFTPVDSTAIQVSVNGVELKLTTGYHVTPLAGRLVHFHVPLYKYDLVSVLYTK